MKHSARSIVTNRYFVGAVFVVVAVLITGIIAGINAQSVRLNLETNAGVLGYTKDGNVHVIVDIDVVNDGWERVDNAHVTIQCDPEPGDADNCKTDTVVVLEDGFSGRISEYIIAPMGSSVMVSLAGDNPTTIGRAPKRIIDVNREAWDCYVGKELSARDSVRCDFGLESYMSSTSEVIYEIIQNELVEDWMTADDIEKLLVFYDQMLGAVDRIKDWGVLLEVTYAGLHEYESYEWDVDYRWNDECSSENISGKFKASFDNLDGPQLDRLSRIRSESSSNKADTFIESGGGIWELDSAGSYFEVDMASRIVDIIHAARPSRIIDSILSSDHPRVETTVDKDGIINVVARPNHATSIDVNIDRSSRVYTIQSYTTSNSFSTGDCTKVDVSFSNPRYKSYMNVPDSITLHYLDGE